MAKAGFQLVIKIYDAADVARFVEAIRGWDGDRLVQTFADPARAAKSLHNFHAPRTGRGGTDWIATASLKAHGAKP